MVVARILQLATNRHLLTYRLVGSYGQQQVVDMQHHNYSTSIGNYYDVLEVTPKASQSQIKAAYYRLSKKYHPDVASDIHDAKEKFSRLSTAYEVLGNPRTRRLYDSGTIGTFSGTASSGDHTPVDPEYHEFLRRRGSFRSRHGGPIPTGRSPMFDFDEFYRQHYGDSIKQTQQSREKKISFDEVEKQRYAEDRRNLVLYGLTFIGTIVMFVLRSRFKL